MTFFKRDDNIPVYSPKSKKSGYYSGMLRRKNTKNALWLVKNRRYYNVNSRWRKKQTFFSLLSWFLLFFSNKNTIYQCDFGVKKKNTHTKILNLTFKYPTLVIFSSFSTKSDLLLYFWATNMPKIVFKMSFWGDFGKIDLLFA